jgi:hypothetical protein
MMDGHVVAALVTSVIKHGGARISAAVLLVVLGMLIGNDANSRPQPHKSILYWASTFAEIGGICGLGWLFIFPQRPSKSSPRKGGKLPKS